MESIGRRSALALGTALLLIVACRPAQGAADSAQAASDSTASMARPQAALDTATFGGGCFWCMEPPFDKLAGVASTTSGYMGGTGHAEVVQVVFDPARVSYAKLLEVFWRNIDPLTPNRQFCDAGNQYRSAIFHNGAAQEAAAKASRSELAQSGRFKDPIVTEVAAATQFYPAEEYHQDYYTKNPIRYKFYRGRCGRDARLRELWGEPGS